MATVPTLVCLAISTWTAATEPPLPAPLETGSLIFSQGDCLAVRIFSQSPFTHVGVVVRQGNGLWVYDAMNGPGVRKQPLEDYLRGLIPCEVHVVSPVTALDEAETTALVRHLERELGRPYGITHHLTGERARGVHCSEYATEALCQTGRLTAERPPRVSPGSLREGLLAKGAFRDAGPFPCGAPLVPISAEETCCQRWWRETGECCEHWSAFWNRSILCRGD